MENQTQAAGYFEEEVDLAQYWAVINRHKWSILTLAILVTLLAGLIVYSMTPVYQATARLLIEPQQPKLPSVEELYGLAGKDKQYYRTQMELLKSRRLAEKVIGELKLDSNPEFVPDETNKGALAALRGYLRLSEAGRNDAHKLDGVVAAFRRRLKVSLLKDTQLITVSFESESPELAARVANTLAQAYIDDQLSSRANMTRRATKWMEQRLRVLKQKLKESAERLQAYKEANGLIDVKGVNTLTAHELDELTKQYVRAQGKYSELSKHYGPKHPKLIAALAEVKSAQRALERGKLNIQRISRKGVRLKELQRQVESNQRLYDTFLSSLKEASQAMDLKSANARISDPAVAPLKPIRPKKGLILILTFLTSIVMGILLAFLHEAMDKTFKSPEEIEEKLGQPVLGVLPFIKANRKDRKSQMMAMTDAKQSSFAEAMRTIRTGLLLSGLDNPHKVILVTSSIPGEGKTVVSTNLAIAMAQMEKVLLLGADLRRPSLSKSLGLDEEAGLSNVVAGTSELKSCIRHLEDINVDILPCGQIPPNPLELLSSERFARLLDALEEHYDRIVIDSPPVQAVSDALVLARHARAVVYVIEADATHEKIVLGGIKRLTRQDIPFAGIVLNKLNVAKAAKSGYDYSGYYDHYGYSHSDKA